MSRALNEVLFVGVGGFIGAVARFATANVMARFFPSTFFTGTLVVNTVGCLLLGCCVAVLEARQGLDHPLRLFFVVGVLGAFTTFSAFTYETLEFIRAGNFVAAFSYILFSFVLGLIAISLGLFAMRALDSI